MTQAADSLIFPCGAKMKNRFMLAPLTNTQSHEDGKLSEEEFQWLIKRAEGQFGLVMTCASHVTANGKGFPGQLGVFGEEHVEGHTRLAKAIKSYGSLAVVQLYHGGMRADPQLIEGDPVSASAVERKGTRGLTLEEVKTLRDHFIQAAERAKKCGYDGIELHGAHGYLIAQFLSEKINKRTDAYGGNLENRSRLLFEIIEGIRNTCGKDFLLGVRLSPERFGMKLTEIKDICQRLIEEGKTDFIDISLWDSFKIPVEEEHQEKTLLQHFTELDFKKVVLSVAGQIQSAEDVSKILQSKVDAVSIGRSAILHHDFPVKVIQEPNFEPISLPVSAAHLREEGLSDAFINYMRNWEGFVANKE